MKTAQDIIKQITGVESVEEDANILCEISEIKQAMREFAAQEVEAYKARLKRLIEDQHYSNSSMAELSFPQIIGLIDTIK